MPTHDPTHCRDQLAALITAQNAQLATLEGLLAREYDLLQSRDAEGLEKAGTTRQQCTAQILHFEDQRGALCRATGRGDDPAGLLSLLAWCDPAGLLRPAMQEFRERTLRCREQNDRNGMLVNASLQRVAKSQEGKTYGPGNDKAGGHGRVLITRA